MLNVWLNQAFRFFSHSGTCWTRPISAMNSGGRIIAAGIRKTIVVWYDWLRGVRTTNSCATAAVAAKTMNVGHPRASGLMCASSGNAAAAETAAMLKKYARARGDQRDAT